MTVFRRVEAKGPVTLGIDVSKHQGPHPSRGVQPIDWSTVAKNCAFAYIRVSDGVKWPDKHFKMNWQEAKKAGLLRGVYQFVRPSQSLSQQLEVLFTKLDAAGGMEEGDMPIMCDLESTDGEAWEEVSRFTLAWLNEVKIRTEMMPLLYMYPTFWFNNELDVKLTRYPLWIAHYTEGNGPWVPNEWENWDFWQYSGSGTLPGVHTIVDMNYFNGDMPHLLEFIRNSSIKKDVPPVIEPT
ncbi:MAG: glycoside hydrolase family 25 protein, partial [Candidatus Thorarchaeota archaeon]